MEKVIEIIAKSLVEKPEAVTITQHTKDDDTVVYEIHVAPDDMGKIIGKQGRIAKAMRTVVKAAATRENKRVMVEIV